MFIRMSYPLAIVVGISIVACAATNDDARGALYGTTLEECNRTSKTLCESIVCENHARAANGRMARPVPASCNDQNSGNANTSIGPATAGDAGTVNPTVINSIKDSEADHE